MKFAFVNCMIGLTLLFAGPTLSAKPLLFSHSTHPVVNTILIPMLEDVYSELGYQLTFQQAEGARAVKLLNEGAVDGDVARLQPLLSSLNDTIAVAQLDTIHVILLCRKDISCNEDVLLNPKLRVLVPTVDATLTLLTNDILAKRYFNNDWQNVVTMFNAGKVDYLLWIESRLIPPLPLTNANRSSTNIGPFGLYHILHKKHQHLAEPIADMLKQRLAQLELNSAAAL
ncbi:MAG: hypothetical protein KKE94_04990 [Gammaproteobacteria bacterium]|nr:hypothetical protein [Gammaproteobacteria bacterium]